MSGKRISAVKEVTAIQEVNYKRINTQQLFESLKAYAENLSTESGDLRLNSDYAYKFGGVLLDDTNLNIIDIAVDECDTFYLIDQEQIFTYDTEEAVLKTVGYDSGFLPLKLNLLSAIGVDKDTLYIADCISENKTSKNSRLIAFAKRDLQIRWILSMGSDGKPLSKILDLEITPKGNIYILEEEGRVLCIRKDSFDYPAPSLFYSKDTEAPKQIPIGFAVDIDSNLYILNKTDDKTDESIFNIETKEEIIPIKGFSPSGIAVDIWKQVFVGESEEGSNKEASLKTIHKLSDGEFTPVWSYRGESGKLITDSKGNLYVINGKGNKLTFLARKKGNLLDSKGSFKGTYISKPIDSQTPQTRWHRLLVEGVFEKGTQVEFLYYVSDQRLSDNEITALNPEQWSKCILEVSAVQGDSKRDALFLDEVQGRYLWFKIVLSGSEIRSPVIKTVTIFFPRISYVDYLPAIYQEDPVSRGLLERFLAIFESIFFEIDLAIEHIDRFFETYGIPSDFLSWLGSWLAMSMDEDWPEEKKRLFIENAVSLYKMRGTRQGLERSIELFTGKKPFIVESFRASRTCTGDSFRSCNEEKTIFFPSEEAKIKKCLGDESAEDSGSEEPLVNSLFGTERFGFCVLMKASDMDLTTQSRVRRIIEEQKPAHTSYELKMLEPWFYLDMHTYLGVNTALTKPQFVLGKTSVIGRDTVLHDEEQAGQVERHSRVEIDILLS